VLNAVRKSGYAVAVGREWCASAARAGI
jgi:hypothetical protein